MRIQADLAVDDKTIDTLVERFRQVVEKTVAAQIDKLKDEVGAKEEEAKPRRPPIITPEGVELPDSETLRAGDLRRAVLLGKIPEDTGILIDGKTTAKLLNVSYRTLYRLGAMKAMPEPIKIGTLARWRLTEILEWVDNGCPSRWQWPTTRSRKR